MAGSYLGHGAKYWADRYFESQSQTRLPDDSGILEWKDKYLNLEKCCSLYQSKIADLRAEIADLHEKNISKSDDYLTEDFNAILSDSKKALKNLEDSCNDTFKKLKSAEEKIKFLQTDLKSANDKLDFYLHHKYKLLAKYLFFLFVFTLGSFFLGRLSMNSSSGLYVNLVPCLVFLISGCSVSYAFCSSKYADSRKAQKDSYDKHLEEQKEAFVKDLSALVDGLDLLSLSNAPESSYLDQKGLPHIIVDGEDICTVSYTPTGEVFHQAKKPCIKYLQTTNLAYLVPCSACARCNPIIPDLSWYGRCLSNAEILRRYGITIHIPISADEAIHRQQISSMRFVSFGIADVRFKKGFLDSMINFQIANSHDEASPAVKPRA